MRTHRTKAHVLPNQPLLVPLPADTPESDVDVIVLFPESGAPSPAFTTLTDFNAWLLTQPAVGRSRAEIDAALAAERATWD